MNVAAAITGAVGLALGFVIGGLVNDGTATPPETNGPATATTVDQPAATHEKVRLRIASTAPTTLPVIGSHGKRLEELVSTMSGGDLEVRLFEPGALVPALEVFDAVSSGSVDGGWSVSSYWAGKVPALQFFNSVPFGPETAEQFAWMRYGGGRELYEEIYHRYNIHPLVCWFIPQDGSGWFRKPIDSPEDFRGLKIRFLGLGGRVLEKFGASTQLLAGGDIYPALELGTIDAAEFSMPVIDEQVGFQEVAKHYYMPGWHQSASMGEAIFNLDRWNALGDQYRAMLETACGENSLDAIAYGEAIQAPALRSLEKDGVTIHRWPPEILDAFHEAWQEVVADEAKTDPDFARVWESLSAFRQDYALWRQYSRLD